QQVRGGGLDQLEVMFFLNVADPGNGLPQVGGGFSVLGIWPKQRCQPAARLHLLGCGQDQIGRNSKKACRNPGDQIAVNDQATGAKKLYRYVAWRLNTHSRPPSRYK